MSTLADISSSPKAAESVKDSPNCEASLPSPSETKMDRGASRIDPTEASTTTKSPPKRHHAPLPKKTKTATATATATSSIQPPSSGTQRPPNTRATYAIRSRTETRTPMAAKRIRTTSYPVEKGTRSNEGNPQLGSSKRASVGHSVKHESSNASGDIHERPLATPSAKKRPPPVSKRVPNKPKARNVEPDSDSDSDGDDEWKPDCEPPSESSDDEAPPPPPTTGPTPAATAARGLLDLVLDVLAAHALPRGQMTFQAIVREMQVQQRGTSSIEIRNVLETSDVTTFGHDGANVTIIYHVRKDTDTRRARLHRALRRPAPPKRHAAQNPTRGYKDLSDIEVSTNPYAIQLEINDDDDVQGVCRTKRGNPGPSREWISKRMRGEGYGALYKGFVTPRAGEEEDELSA